MLVCKSKHEDNVLYKNLLTLAKYSLLIFIPKWLSSAIGWILNKDCIDPTTAWQSRFKQSSSMFRSFNDNSVIYKLNLNFYLNFQLSDKIDWNLSKNIAKTESFLILFWSILIILNIFNSFLMNFDIFYKHFWFFFDKFWYFWTFSILFWSILIFFINIFDSFLINFDIFEHFQFFFDYFWYFGTFFVVFDHFYLFLKWKLT